MIMLAFIDHKKTSVADITQYYNNHSEKKIAFAILSEWYYKVLRHHANFLCSSCIFS